jgi:hypothetical protein
VNQRFGGTRESNNKPKKKTGIKEISTFCLLHTGLFFGLFNPEDGGGMFLRNGVMS